MNFDSIQTHKHPNKEIRSESQTSRSHNSGAVSSWLRSLYGNRKTNDSMRRVCGECVRNADSVLSGQSVDASHAHALLFVGTIDQICTCRYVETIREQGSADTLPETRAAAAAASLRNTLQDTVWASEPQTVTDEGVHCFIFNSVSSARGRGTINVKNNDRMCFFVFLFSKADSKKQNIKSLGKK